MAVNTVQKELLLLRKGYDEALPNVLIANEKIQTVLGFESESCDTYGRLIIAPWHVPLPRELQRQLPKPSPRQLDTRSSSMDVGPDPRRVPISKAVSGPPVRMSKRKTEPANQLERALHNKSLAQQISGSESAMPIPSRSRDISLPILTKSGNASKVTTETANNKLKRKLSAENDGDISESPSPPRRRPMPPIEAVLAHGFRNINLDPRYEPPTPRSHAFDPWTDLFLGHRVLTPTPAFLLSLNAFRNDDSEDASYWKSSLPVIISYHLANPATLVHETNIERLTFHLPVAKSTLINDARNGRRGPLRARQPHYKYEGPETNAEIRLIRMILPPTLPNKLYERKDHQAPFTDWLILCLSSPAPSSPSAPTHTHNLRSTAQKPQQPYLIIAFPTHLFREKEFIDQTPVVSPIDQQQQDIATTTMLKFEGRARLPLMFGVNRDSAFAERWVQQFAHGNTALEVTNLGREAPCWM